VPDPSLNLTSSEQAQLDANPNQRAYFEALSDLRDQQQEAFAIADAQGISINDEPAFQPILDAVALKHRVSPLQGALLNDYPGSAITAGRGYYFTDPSGLGSWYVPEGMTPFQGLQNAMPNWRSLQGAAFIYSVDHNPDIKTLGYGAPEQASGPNPRNAIHATPKFISTVPIQSTPDCPIGYFYDAFHDACVTLDSGTQPLEAGPVGVTVQPTGAAVTVTVNNAVNLAEGVGKAIAEAVDAGIENAVELAKESASEAANAVTSGIKSIVDNIGAGVQSLLDGLKSGLEWIGNLIKNNIGALINFITDHIGKIVSVVTDALKTINDAINNVIIPVIKKVDDVLTNTIAPIFNTISRVFQQVTGLIEAIRRDVNNGIQGLLQLPNDIANSLTGLEATLNRISQQLSFKRKDGTNVTIDEALGDAVGGSLANFGKLLTSPVAAPTTPTTFHNLDRLTDPTILEALGRSFDSLWKEIVTFVRGIWQTKEGPLDALKSVPLLLPLLTEVEWSVPTALLSFVFATLAAYRPALKFIEEDIAAKTGLAKLSPADALAAWVRRFIEEVDLRKELAVNGWDASRIQTLMDLQQYLIGIEPIIDMWHRGIVTANDLDENLADHALIGADRTAVIAASYRLFDPGLAGAMWLRRLITEDQLNGVLKVNRYTQPEADAFKTLLIRPGGPNVTLARIRNNALVASRLVSSTDLFTPPADIFQSAQDVGTSSDEATEIWRDQFQVPAIGHWLALYFRGLRTRSELDAVFDYFHVLPEWRDDVIRANQALIPFRTIPAMLAAGIISEPYAKQQLEAHGFDLTQIDALLKYAGARAKTSKAVTAKTINTLSLATVEEFWKQHAITDEQYVAALQAHGYDRETAQLELRVKSLAEHAKERTTVATDIVNEALAGVITDEQAAQQLSQQGFGIGESARYLKQLRSTKRANAKLPTEAELLAFYKKGIITGQDYADGLKANGFTAKWVDAFVRLNVKPALQPA